MPILLPKDLPAIDSLKREGIFAMSPERASVQEIRPLKIIILNLMPTKVETETQLTRLLSNTPLQVQVTFLTTDSYEAKNTSKAHLSDFYTTFKEVKDQYYDGLIVTGAPVEHLSFEEVDYWQEIEQILEWSLTNVYATLHICWGAQAGLYHHYDINKVLYDTKLTGVFRQHICTNRPVGLLRGLDSSFTIPHSRYAGIDEEKLKDYSLLEVLVTGEETGPSIISRRDGRQTYMLGHAEYDRHTLKKEYERDAQVNKNPQLPVNYFKDDDPTQEIIAQWTSSAHLLFNNWINQVYQNTPYHLDQLLPINL
ncbi:homoserine O-succinyltransferase [Dolosicoccus paucivorans]|uniref:Homoserine O-acetyltransferase n=1 Tax=Dolosicoccus paucivorans TaxID=84521 RepID=A0A2N6SLU6_9LACT|nr:homoserine O-succinyltransferase [Dolosicoccus paucivorans]PMB84921.1 homoserine O-succinyltransferase [Dolosicoccus paucivorans]PMC58044.1 homoserine O-succinyltransferase [Dolosicoccus paucivorans]